MTQKSLQINEVTQGQIDDLVRWGHGPHFSSIVRTAIDRMWNTEKEKRTMRRCSVCGQSVDGEDWFVRDGQPVHEDCAHGHVQEGVDSLQELTGKESGAVQYNNGDIWIGNWTQVAGIPREFATGTIGLGETLLAKRCATPKAVRRAMQDYELEQVPDMAPSQAGWRSWCVTAGNEEVTVTINHNWI